MRRCFIDKFVVWSAIIYLFTGIHVSQPNSIVAKQAAPAAKIEPAKTAKDRPSREKSFRSCYITQRARGERAELASRGLRIDRELIMEATAYYPKKRGRERYATYGGLVHCGVVAVDPGVIKPRSTVLVEGFGIRYANDTGGSIKGPRIDICVGTYAEAMRFGRRHVKLKLLKPIR